MLEQSDVLHNLTQLLKHVVIIGQSGKKKKEKKLSGTPTLQECLLHVSVLVKLSARRASVPRCSVPTTPEISVQCVKLFIC